MAGLSGKERSRNHRITVMLLGSGFAAVQLADYEDMGWSPDVVQTGIGRYSTREQAEREARSWAKAEQLPLVGVKP